MHDKRRTYKHDERRRYARTRSFRIARLFADARIGCGIVHNVSATGAGLRMVSTASVPDTFDLSYDGGLTLRHCRVLWRTATEIGLEFQGRSFIPSLIEPEILGGPFPNPSADARKRLGQWPQLPSALHVPGSLHL